MIATHLIRLGSRVVDKTTVIGETGSPFSPVAYRLLGTQTPDEIFPAIRLPVDTVSGKQTGINRKKLNGLVVLVRKVSIAPQVTLIREEILDNSRSLRRFERTRGITDLINRKDG